MSDPAAGAAGDDADAPRAIVGGHGDFAAGVISAVTQIAGRGGLFVAISNRGQGADALLGMLRAEVDRTGARVVFTDLPAGSVTIAARRLQRERPDVVVVTGVNLATLLDFAFFPDLTPAEAGEQAAAKGRASIAVSAVRAD